jgi:L-ribulokinase
MAKYTIGLDYGTRAIRALLVDTRNGEEVASAEGKYTHGKDGVMSSDDPEFARHHPKDYLDGTASVLKKLLTTAKKQREDFDPQQVVGLGVAATGSTPLPVDRSGQPLALYAPFDEDPDAMARLWKDHTAIPEAEEITQLARRTRPQLLARTGGIYSSEWFFSKIYHCLKHNPKVFDAAYTWVEVSDWVPAFLTGTQAPEDLAINVCAAGHKAMFSADWGGYPDEKFFLRLDSKLADLRTRLKTKANTIGQSVGGLCEQWAKKTSLPEGIPVSTGAVDSHLAAIGAGIGEGTLVKILGTGACDMMVAPEGQPLRDIPGLCGIVRGSILPGYFGLEAGQCAVGDIFEWFSTGLQPGGKRNSTHAKLTEQAETVPAGASGLLGLDWHNGNRSVLVDPLLRGMMLGQNLRTTPAELYRALIESTAYGALTIINRLEQYDVTVRDVVNCGGVAEQNPFVLQLYADVTGRVMKVARTSNASALGAAVAGAVVAGEYRNLPEAQQAMTGIRDLHFEPRMGEHAVYRKLYRLYKQLHDAFGTTSWKGNLGNVMKELLEIRAAVRNGEYEDSQ